MLSCFQTANLKIILMCVAFFCFFIWLEKKCKLHLRSQLRTKSLSGGIGRRARLKLVFFGVWVRFPPQVLKTSPNLILGDVYFRIKAILKAKNAFE